jgi:AraC family transcriptional regulator
MDRRIQQVTTLIRDEFTQPLSLQDMARTVNLSLSHFRRLFRAETGQTPSRYLKERRMKKAKELAEQTHFSVKEIIHYVGMGDDSHFLRDFERLYGLSPTRLRADVARKGHTGTDSQP